MSEIITTPSNKKRNYGIDLLRMTAMLFVVILHFLGHGGVLENVSRGSSAYYAAWSLEIWCYCAVNVFALISGYFGYREDRVIPSFSRYVLLWFEVVFYSILIKGIMIIAYSEPISGGELMHLLTPVTSRAYWYFRAYTGAFIMMPLFNSAVRHLSKAGCRKMIVIIAAVLPILSFYSDPFELNSGYGFAWISIIYLLGALIRKTGAFSTKKTRGLIISGIALYIATVISQFIADSPSGLGGIHISLVNYVSPTIVLISIIWLELFRRIDVDNRLCTGVISTLSAGAFAVYLIDDNSLFRAHFISERFKDLAKTGAVEMITVVLITSIVLTLACMCIDIVRRKLFTVIRMDRLANYIEKQGKAIICRIADAL